MFNDYMKKVAPYKWFILGGTLILIVVALLFFKGNKKESSDVLLQSAIGQVTSTQVSSSSDSSSTTTTSVKDNGYLMVDVKGAVKSAGVYELPVGSRVTDAIKKAGGFREDADQKSINLAQKLTDESVVYVATPGEVETTLATSAATTSTSGTSTQSSSSTINLNKATLADLQTITGIGAKRAQDILDYRESKGGFSSIDELKNISGIGEKTFEKIKDAVSVD